MAPYSNSRIMRRCGQLGIPYSEAIGCRYFIVQGLAAPDLIVQHTEGAEGFMESFGRRRPVDTSKSLPHDLTALQKLLGTHPDGSVPRSIAVRESIVHLKTDQAVECQPTGADTSRIAGDGTQVDSNANDTAELLDVSDGEDEQFAFTPILEDDANYAPNQQPLESPRDRWTTKFEEESVFGGEDWGSDFAHIPSIDGDGLLPERAKKPRRNDNGHLERGKNGRKSNRRARKVRDTRISVDAGFCSAWCDYVFERDGYSDEDLKALLAECTGNTRHIDLHRNVSRTLELFGYEGPFENEMVKPLSEAKGSADADELFLAVDSLLNQSTRRPGTERFIMNRKLEESVLQQLSATRQKLNHAILLHDVTISRVFKIREQRDGKFNDTLADLNRWIELGRVTHGKAWRGAVAALERLRLKESEIQQVVAGCGRGLAEVRDVSDPNIAFEDYVATAERMKVMYLPIVRRVAARLAKANEDLEDAFQAGTIGMLRAIDLAQGRSAPRFRNYLGMWVTQSILQWRAISSRMIRIPLNRQTEFERFESAEQKVELNRFGSPDTGRIAGLLGCSVDDVRTFMRFPQSQISMRAIPRQELGSLSEDPEQNLEKWSLSDTVEAVLNTIKPRQATILRLYFGINSEREHTLEEIGVMFGVTRERIRQIRDKAIEQLQRPIHAQILADFLIDGRT